MRIRIFTNISFGEYRHTLVFVAKAFINRAGDKPFIHDEGVRIFKQHKPARYSNLWIGSLNNFFNGSYNSGTREPSSGRV